MTEQYQRPQNENGAGRTIAIVAVVAIVGLGVAYAAGLFNIDSSGSLTAPTVTVEGGEVPKVQVETADIDVGTKTKTIEVPTVSVTPAGDDGSANR